MSVVDDRITISPDLAARLVATQLPHWAGLPVRPVEASGWDNRTFRLGNDKLLRFPSAERYASQVEKEQVWLPRLAPELPLPIPVPIASGKPGEGYPWAWSVLGWIEGAPISALPPIDLGRLAADLADLLAALHRIDPAGGPEPGPHSFGRGGPPALYDRQVRCALEVLDGRVDVGGASAVWDAALAASFSTPPVWVHGDIAPGNLLVSGGRLCAVIDFGQLAVGDPACDLAIAWTTLDDAARQAFRDALPLDPGAWARGRGWALWKALIIMSGRASNQADAERCPAVVEAVLRDHARHG